MDKEVIVLMLESVKNTHLIGAKYGDYEIGERVNFAINNNLVTRTETGTFLITEKGNDLLEGKLKWTELYQ